MESTFLTIFYLKRQVVKNNGSSPIMGRITIDGMQTQFSCKLTIDTKMWDTKTGCATGCSTAALETNRMLDKIRVRIGGHYQEIMDRGLYTNKIGGTLFGHTRSVFHSDFNQVKHFILFFSTFDFLL